MEQTRVIGPEAPAKVDAQKSAQQPLALDTVLPGSPGHFLQRMHLSSGNRQSGRWLQAKLKIGAPDDAQEREADRVAEALVSSTERDTSRIQTPSGLHHEDAAVERKNQEPTTIRRKPSSSGECSECDEDERTLRRAPVLAGTLDDSPSIVDQVLGTPGSSLHPSDRAFFESRLGVDLSRVRVHTDSLAEKSAQAVHARAYTVDQHLVFGKSQYSPESSSGKHLLAHELAHFVQQRGAQPVMQRQPLDPTEDPERYRTVHKTLFVQSLGGAVTPRTWKNPSPGEQGTAVEIFNQFVDAFKDLIKKNPMSIGGDIDELTTPDVAKADAVEVDKRVRAIYYQIQGKLTEAELRSRVDVSTTQQTASDDYLRQWLANRLTSWTDISEYNIGESDARYQKLLKDLLDDAWAGPKIRILASRTAAYTVETPGNPRQVFINKGANELIRKATLIHEIVHFYAHADFKKWVVSTNAPRPYKEGFTEYLAEKVMSKDELSGGASYKSAVEKIKDDVAKYIPDDDIARAYFMGETWRIEGKSDVSKKLFESQVGIEAKASTKKEIEESVKSIGIVEIVAPGSHYRFMNLGNDQTNPKPEHLAAFQEIYKNYAEKDDSARVRFVGHASSPGTEKHNDDLSLRRAQAFYDMARQAGVPDSKLLDADKPPHFGETKPTAQNADVYGRAFNRRVELFITHVAPAQPAPNPPEKEPLRRRMIPGEADADGTALHLGNQASLTGSEAADREASSDQMIGVLQRKCSCGDSADSSGQCSRCREEDERRLQRSQVTTTPQLGGVPPIVNQVLTSPGAPLDRATRNFFEPRLGVDLGGVRVHADAEAASSAESVHALAYTVGQNVVFGSSQYLPQSNSGRHLLAHELAHVAQQAQGGVSLYRRQDEDEISDEREADHAADQLLAGEAVIFPKKPHAGSALQLKKNPSGEPPHCQMYGSLAGFRFVPQADATFAPGPIFPQLLAMELKKLLGDAYSSAVVEQYIQEWGAFPLYDVNVITQRGKFAVDEVRGPIAKGGEQFRSIFLAPQSIRQDIRILAKQGKQVVLPPDQLHRLELGEAAAFAYKQRHFPGWFTRAIFLSIMASRGRLLSSLSEAMRGEANPAAQGSLSQARAADISDSLQDPINAIESIRTDPALVKHPVYRWLWPTSQATKGGTSGKPTMAEANQPADTIAAARLIAYSDARPILTQNALKASEARKQLLDSYQLASVHQRILDPQKGDQKISDFPTDYTAPPYASTLSVHPTLEASLYGSTRSEYGFEMSLEKPDLASAFQSHDYNFVAYHVPDDKLVNAAKSVPGSEKRASHWELLKSRLRRDEKYREADVRAYANSIWDQIGPPGKAADLINLNAAMRSFGSVIGTMIETIFDPSDVARFTFPDEGLYIVRCFAQWNPGVEVTLKRPPSVAYQPLFARDAELLAEMRLQTQVGEIEEAKKRLPLINKKIDKTKDPKLLKEFKDQKAQLEAIIGGVEGLLTYQQGVVGATTDRGKKLQDILDTRTAKGFGKDSERLPAVYVSDSGQVLDLLIEVRSENVDPNGIGDYFVHDSTTPSGKTKSASGKRHDAIVEALKSLFKDSEYGRGRASVMIDGIGESIDVPTVSVPKMLMEAAENTATLLTIIAIAAAPFTGGASMALMVPSMVIGAVPSAYNVITQVKDHRLHVDLALAMDIVNVVGAAVGVGAETRAGMQAIRLGTAGGRVLIFTGLGVMGASVLLMSEGVLDQLDAIKDMPEGLRNAEVMKILGKYMMQAGIMVGGILASQARAGGEAPRTFDEWLAELDEPTRERVMESKSAANPADNFWKTYSEMDPLVRDLLTQCGSDCIPMDPPPLKADQARIKKLAEGLSPRARRTLKGLLHDNRTPAAMDAVLSVIEEARDKAPPSKGSAKKLEAVEKAVLARGTGADFILANFSEAPVEALDKQNPGKWKRARQLAEEIAKAGKLDLDSVAKVLDNIRRTEGGDPEEMLSHLKRLSDLVGKVDGVDRILGPDGLSGTFRRFKGAQWTLRFLTEAGLWDKVSAFEESVPGALDRLVDLRLSDGTRVELKSWASWHSFFEASFSRQIMADWLPTNGLRDPLVWAFEPGEGIGTKADLIKKMSNALDKAVQEKWQGYDDAFAQRRADALKAKLPEIIRVGSK